MLKNSLKHRFSHRFNTRLNVVYLSLLATFSHTALADNSALCATPAALISEIQGESDESPLVDRQVIVRANVSAVKPGMGGYFLQEEPQDWDKLTTTSEGIFVADRQFNPKVGDNVMIRGKVAEENGLTKIKGVSALMVCSENNKVEPLAVLFPLKTAEQMESYEGMLVKITQLMVISENYNYARFGQLLLSTERLYHPTSIAPPGPEADRIALKNSLSQIVLDDSFLAKDQPIDFDADHLIRTGNQLNQIEGVIHYDFNRYMIEPTAKLQLIKSNKREESPNVSKKGNLRVASFNVLNYFNGEGEQKSFPTTRGANSPLEFERQSAKIIAALTEIKGDIVGLMEIENDGYGPSSAIAELTAQLTKASGLNYQYVKPKTPLGDDAIAVGLIYNADKVALVGDAATLASGPFDGKNRQPLLQTFKQKQNGAVLSVVVNHFKSKGRCPIAKVSLDADQGNGQGCWNETRTQAAIALAQWLATDPTHSGDKDLLIIGDLNAYGKEQPVTTLVAQGYHDLLDKYQGKTAYSYVFNGLAGYLDHALASASLLDQSVYATEWHINADEMAITDYNLERKSPTQQQSLYRADPFRSSDHDPVIIELALK